MQNTTARTTGRKRKADDMHAPALTTRGEPSARDHGKEEDHRDATENGARADVVVARPPAIRRMVDGDLVAFMDPLYGA